MMVYLMGMQLFYKENVNQLKKDQQGRMVMAGKKMMKRVGCRGRRILIQLWIEDVHLVLEVLVVGLNHQERNLVVVVVVLSVKFIGLIGFVNIFLFSQFFLIGSILSTRNKTLLFCQIPVVCIFESSIKILYSFIIKFGEYLRCKVR